MVVLLIILNGRSVHVSVSLSLSLVFRDLRRVSSLAHQDSAACHTALVLRTEEQIQDTGGDKHSSSGKRRHPALRSFCFDAADISGTVRKSKILKMPRRKPPQVLYKPNLPASQARCQAQPLAHHANSEHFGSRVARHTPCTTLHSSVGTAAGSDRRDVGVGTCRSGSLVVLWVHSVCPLPRSWMR